MKESKLRIAQVGVANFGSYRRDVMRETGLFELVAAYDINPAALEECYARDGARPAASYEELLETPGIEAVVVATGAKFHADQAVAAAEKGLHVYVEKPLCCTPGELRALFEVQRRTGVVITVGHTNHHHNAWSAKIKELIDSGELGTIATFEKTTAHSGGLQIQPGDWRGDPDKNPGGMLFQCGVHALHELMFYFGPITAVHCSMRYDVHHSTETADVALCQLHFASGLIGTLNAYHVTPYHHTFNVLGTRASLYRDERFFDEGTNLLIQRVGQREAKELKVPVEVDISTTDRGANVKSFYHAIREGGVPSPSLLDGAAAVAVVFAAEESAETGRIVSVAPYFEDIERSAISHAGKPLQTVNSQCAPA